MRKLGVVAVGELDQDLASPAHLGALLVEKSGAHFGPVTSPAAGAAPKSTDGRTRRNLERMEE